MRFHAFPILLSALGCVCAAAKPVVFRVSDPVAPGETALLFGDGMDPKATVEGWRVPETGGAPAPRQLVVLQASDLSVKVVIPKEWKPGLFAVRVKTPGGVSDTVWLNRTEAWWFLAGPGGNGNPGGELRLFGKNLGPSTTAWLTSGGTRIPLTARKGEPYSAKFEIPANTAPGAYGLTASNGFGGKDGESKSLPVRIEAKPAAPARKWKVTDFGASGEGSADDTAAFRNALAKAGAEGGGIVLIPAGRYRITGKLTVPPNTTVRGEKRESVWLFVPKEAPEFDSVFTGSTDFAVEELSLVARNVTRLITAPDIPDMYRKPWGTMPVNGRKASRVRLHRLRLQHLMYSHRVGKGDARRGIDVGYSTVVLAGDDMELSDSEIVSSGMPVTTYGTRRLRIEGNHLQTGRNGWYGINNSEETLFENNNVEGRDLEASYGGFQKRSYRIYYAGNRLHDAYGDEREALTFDTPYLPQWMGRIGTAGEKTLTTHDYNGAEKRWRPGELKGEVCLIAYGKGVGEYIPIADNDETTITLASPWVVTPDSSSHLVIRANRTDIVITGNQFADASVAVQLFAQSYGVIVDGNRSERTGGMYGLGWDFTNEQAKARQYSTCMFNSWLNNELTEGFVYQQGTWSNGMLGPAADGRNGKLDPPAITTIGNVIRNNRVSDHNTIGAFLTGRHPVVLPDAGPTGYMGRDTIIEGNTITGAEVAIDIYPGFRDTVVRNNRVENCTVPLSDDGVNTWTEPKDNPKQISQGAVKLNVTKRLVGLHCQRTRTGIQLRTEPWAPEMTAEAAGKSVTLKPNTLAELPPADEIRVTLNGAPVRVMVPAAF